MDTSEDPTQKIICNMCRVGEPMGGSRLRSAIVKICHRTSVDTTCSRIHTPRRAGAF